ncbi:MAG: L-2-amino-thiazoline-4-carboxylic acid hydrolase [Candidatus Heimdallarchaeota archaeon]
MVSLEEAVDEVHKAIARLALLHLSFSKTLIEEFGEQIGEELVIKSIMEYGKRIADRISKGKSDLPKWGVYSGNPYQDEKGRFIVQGCNLAKVFKEYGEETLGRMYCYVDAAKSMASDSANKLIHTTCEACGDDQCTFEYVPTTEEERKHFVKRDRDWKYIDPLLV